MFSNHKNEVEAKAAEFGFHAAKIERDYIFGWLLAGVYRTSPLKDVLILKGENCFRKEYFPRTRFSNDLDFSSIERRGAFWEEVPSPTLLPLAAWLEEWPAKASGESASPTKTGIPRFSIDKIVATCHPLCS